LFDVVIASFLVVFDALRAVADSVECLVDGTIVFIVSVIVVEPAFVLSLLLVIWCFVLLVVTPVVGCVRDCGSEAARFLSETESVVYHDARKRLF
jgi:hypothetical protein